MCKEVIKTLLGMPQVVGIFKKFGLSIRTYIENILKMTRIHDISVDVVNDIPIS